jgi:hypothetical protein
MKNILEVWKHNYFVQPLLDAILISTLFISLRERRYLSQLKFVPLYLGSFIILMFNTYAYYLMFIDTSFSAFFSSIDRFGNYIVSLIEFIAFSYFLYSTTELLRLRVVLKTIFISTLCIFLFILIKIICSDKLRGMEILNRLYIIESIALFLMILFYSVYYFWLDPSQKINTTSNFWVCLGLSLYLIITIPFTLFINHFFPANLTLYKKSYAVVYMAYIFLFLTIIKAYKCAPKNLN